MSDSAVEFATNTRIHVGLAVTNLERSVPFYRTLLDEDPAKTRPRYAKFEVADPPVNLALNEVRSTPGPRRVEEHFGVQVKSSAAVRSAAARLVEQGFDVEFEDRVTCCHAVQDKVWAVDPDGHRWEVFVVLDDSGTDLDSSTSPCCAPTDAVDPEEFRKPNADCGCSTSSSAER